MDIYEFLKKLHISYQMIEHEPVYTIEEAQFIKSKIIGVGCKNLFLTDQKGNYFLVLMTDQKRAHLKEISKQVGVSHLAFASEETLKQILNLSKGSVTPLGIVNDDENKVMILIEKSLQDQVLLLHPNTNCATIALHYKDLLKIIIYTNHRYAIFDSDYDGNLD